MTVPASNLVCGILLSTGLILTVKKVHDLWKTLRDYTAASYQDLSKAPFLDLHAYNPQGGTIDKVPYAKKIGKVMVNNWEFEPNEEKTGDDRGYLLKGWRIRPLDPFAREQGVIFDAWNDPRAAEPRKEGEEFRHVRF